MKPSSQAKSWRCSSFPLLHSSLCVFLQETVLEQQQVERDNTTFQRICMFCNEEFTGNRCSKNVDKSNCENVFVPHYQTKTKSVI